MIAVAAIAAAVAARVAVGAEVARSVGWIAAGWDAGAAVGSGGDTIGTQPETNNRHRHAVKINLRMARSCFLRG
jgi:hypothetical protein